MNQEESDFKKLKESGPTATEEQFHELMMQVLHKESQKQLRIAASARGKTVASLIEQFHKAHLTIALLLVDQEETPMGKDPDELNEEAIREVKPILYLNYVLPDIHIRSDMATISAPGATADIDPEITEAIIRAMPDALRCFTMEHLAFPFCGEIFPEQNEESEHDEEDQDMEEGALLDYEDSKKRRQKAYEEQVVRAYVKSIIFTPKPPKPDCDMFYDQDLLSRDSTPFS